MHLWELAKANEDVLRVSTLIEAGQFRKNLTDDAAVDRVIEWCRANCVTRVFVESFRTNYSAPRELVERTRDWLRAAGITADGGITTTKLGKDSSGWDLVACYSDAATCDRLQRVFEDAAAMFDLIMIDDFLFTDCECAECTAAKGDRSWGDFRREMMVRLSRERILEPARRVNPNVKIIIKYPQWYDRYHLRGYDVVEQSRMFDYTWAGTELRDPDHRVGDLPRVQQYEGFWVMRWLDLLGGGPGGKCGGGWFDNYATGPTNYLEQAWQTVLGGARDMVLFNYSSLSGPKGEQHVGVLRPEWPALFELARLVKDGPLSVGVQAPKPPHSEAGDGRYVYDMAGMLGLPLIPATTLDPAARAAFVPAENLHDPGIAAKLRAMLDRGGRVLATDGLLDGIGWRESHPNLMRLDVNGEPEGLLRLGRARLAEIRRHLLSPQGLEVDAPARVAVTVLGEDVVAVSNFRDETSEVAVRLGGRTGRVEWTLPSTATVSAAGDRLVLPPRTLAVVRVG